MSDPNKESSSDSSSEESSELDTSDNETFEEIDSQNCLMPTYPLPPTILSPTSRIQRFSSSSSSSSDRDSEEEQEIEKTEENFIDEASSSRKTASNQLAKIFQAKSNELSRSRSNHSEAPDNNANITDVDTRNEEERDHARRGEHDKNIVDEAPQTFVWVGPKRAAKTEVWKHWGFKSFPNKPVDYSRVFCKLCGHCINYKNSNSNMKVHMNSKHKNILTDVESSQPKARQYFAATQPKKKKYPKHHPINKRARAALVKWFCKKDRPFQMAEDPEFSEFCEILDPEFELPSRHTVVRDMEATYKVEKKKLEKKLERVDFVHGTNDGGSAINGESFLSNTVHYVDPDSWELKNAVLGCTVMTESHTAKNYRKHIDATEELFGIKGKVLGYTTDNENKMHAAFKNDERNGCMAHIQSKCMEKAVNAVGCISLLRKKLRKLARLNKFPKFKYAFQEAQKSRNLPRRKVLQEVKTRFTSTLTMCHSVMSFDPDKTKEEIATKAKLNVEAINDALKQVGTKKAKKMILKDSDVDKIVAMSEVLEPICNMLTMLGGEKYVTGSIVLPYLKKVVSLVRIEETDPKFIVEFKSFIIKDFLQRCRDNLNFDLLKKATFLDARFKSLKSLEQTQRDEVREEIKVELKALKVPGDAPKETPDGDPRKKSKKSTKMSLESDDEDDDLSLEKELENYVNEPKLNEDSDPLLDFWKRKESIYPRLSVLARKYLCIQATSTPSERVFSKMGNTVSKKRNRITPAHTNQTIFLSDVL